MINDKIIEVLIKLNEIKAMNYRNEIEIMNFLEFSNQYFEKDEQIQFQTIKLLRKMNKTKEALGICDRFPENELIQSQKITILMKQNKIDEALGICDKFQKNEQIQSQKITILMKQNKIDEALEICDKFQKNEVIQSQKITILQKQNKIDESLEICHRFSEDKYRKKKKVIINSENCINNVFITKKNKPLVSTLLTNIYINNISEEEIQNSDLSDYEKTILLIAYYEKINKKKGINIIKLKKKNTKNIIEVKNYNMLLEKLSRKKNSIFDIIIYKDILKCSINFEKISNSLIEETKIKEIKTSEPKVEVLKNKTDKKSVKVVNNRNVEKIDEQKESKKAEEIKTSEPKVEVSKNKTDEKYITMSGKVVNNRNIEKTDEKEKSTKTKESEPQLIKDIFKNEIISIGKQIYVELYNPDNPERQKDALKAWDILEQIANSSINDKKNLEKILRIINLVYPEKEKINYQKYHKY